MLHTFHKRYLSLLLFIAITDSALSSGGNVQLPYPIFSLKDRIEKEVKKHLQKMAEKHELYDITQLTASSAFQKASFSQKKTLSLAHFKKRKNHTIKEVLTPHLWKQGTITASLIFLIGAMFYFMPKLKRLIKQAFHMPPIRRAGGLFDPSEFLFNMVFPIIITPIIGFLFSFANSLSTLISLYLRPEKLYQSLATLEERYISLKWLLEIYHPDYIDCVESSLANLRIDTHRQELIKIVTELLDLVTNTDRKDNLLTWDENLADEMLAAFKPHIKKQLKTIAFNTMLKINLFKQTGQRELYTVLFYGPPGTGKTYAAYCIAKILDIPAFQVDLGVSNETLFGTQNQRSGSLTQGLRHSLKQKHGDCAMCICDDGDRSINTRKVATSWQLDLLDTSKKHYRDLFFNVNIDKPIILLFTANYGEELDLAAQNRFVSTVHFMQPFTEKGINMILENYMNILIVTYSNLPYSVSKEDFTQEEWQNLIERSRKQSKLKNDQGLRTAKHTVEEYFNKKTKQKYMHYNK